MKNKVFLDSNILIYLYSEDEPIKQSIAKKLISEQPNIIISTQVLFEFSNVAYRKFKLNPIEIEPMLNELNTAFELSLITLNTIKTALTIISKYKYSFVDSMIIASALEQKCSILFSEDMHHQHAVENLTIMNPFKQ